MPKYYIEVNAANSIDSVADHVAGLPWIGGDYQVLTEREMYIQAAQNLGAELDAEREKVENLERQLTALQDLCAEKTRLLSERDEQFDKVVRSLKERDKLFEVRRSEWEEGMEKRESQIRALIDAVHTLSEMAIP